MALLLRRIEAEQAQRDRPRALDECRPDDPAYEEGEDREQLRLSGFKWKLEHIEDETQPNAAGGEEEVELGHFSPPSVCVRSLW